jgi:hypothetical protein
MGDFNVNLLGDSTSARNLVEQFDALNLCVVNMVEPTHFQSGASPLLLDLFLTNTSSEVGFFTQIDLPACRMHHALIYGSMRLRSSEVRVDPIFYYRDYSRVDSEQVVLNVESIDWSTVYIGQNTAWVAKKAFFQPDLLRSV